MKSKITRILSFLFFVLFLFTGCKKPNSQKAIFTENTVKYAQKFALIPYDNFQILKLADKDTIPTKTYILHKKGADLPDSLSQYPKIEVPIQRVIATSTTHLPSIEMLNKEKTLVGFPNPDYISSEVFNALINQKQIVNVGIDYNLNSELIIGLKPKVLIYSSGSGSDSEIQLFNQYGIHTLINSDWTEKTPLGRAEWIRFFGAIYDLDEKALELFEKIETEYLQTLKLAQKAIQKPTVITGNMYQDVWYMPRADNWSALVLEQANIEYPWNDQKGEGSLALSFEEVFSKGKEANIWIGVNFENLDELSKSNIHYKEFRAFKEKNVFGYQTKGKGVLFYELAPNRPDLMLKDLIKIAHPELLEDYSLNFFYKLQ
ncbi:MAG: ABC transporter substrate-binding protein [Bacteroidota bacterium]|nr:ABC transporter substrate-binding protein [Bacteroidota bacterium]